MGDVTVKFYTDHAKIVRYHGSAVAKTKDRITNCMAAVVIAGIVVALMFMIVKTAAGVG